MKEVGQVLKENLCDKFQATKEYEQIQDRLPSSGPAEDMHKLHRGRTA